MIERYALVSGRIRKELDDLEQTVQRAEDAMSAGRVHPQDQRFYIDSAALSLHDYYTGLERIFQQIALHLERSAPEGSDWHRELLRQMSTDIPNVRPAVLTAESARDLDEYLRFRHVVRNVYAFSFDADRIERLVAGVKPCHKRVRTDLLSFADFLERLSHAA